MNDDTKTKADAGDALRVIPLRQAADMIGVSTKTIQRVVGAGALPTVRMSGRGGARWVSLRALREFVEAGGVQPNIAPTIVC